VEIIYIK